MNIFKYFSKRPSSNLKVVTFSGFRCKTFTASNPKDFDKLINDWFLGADVSSLKILYAIPHPAPVGSAAFSITLVCEIDYRGTAAKHPEAFK